MTADTVRIELRRGECPCPGAVHPVEWAEIRAELDLPLAAGALAAVNQAPPEDATVEAALIRAYLPAAIVRWSFLEPDGTGGIRPVPVNRVNMERLVPWDKGGFQLANACDDRYSERLLAPLQALTSNTSPLGQTGDSTSATLPLGSPPPVPSEPSSPDSSADGSTSAAPAP